MVVMGELCKARNGPQSSALWATSHPICLSDEVGEIVAGRRMKEETLN